MQIKPSKVHNNWRELSIWNDRAHNGRHKHWLVFLCTAYMDGVYNNQQLEINSIRLFTVTYSEIVTLMCFISLKAICYVLLNPNWFSTTSAIRFGTEGLFYESKKRFTFDRVPKRHVDQLPGKPHNAKWETITEYCFYLRLPRKLPYAWCRTSIRQSFPFLAKTITSGKYHDDRPTSCMQECKIFKYETLCIWCSWWTAIWLYQKQNTCGSFNIVTTYNVVLRS